MARPTPLMQRWKLQKTKARRSGYWGRGLMKGQPKGPFLKDSDAMAYSKHASNTRLRDLCMLLGYPKEVQDAWRAFYGPPNPTAEQGDPKFSLEKRNELLKSLNEDPHYRLLRFNFVFIEGDENSMFNLSIHFQGQEYFLIEKRVTYLRRSSLYSSKERMMDLFHLGRIQWAARVSLT